MASTVRVPVQALPQRIVDAVEHTAELYGVPHPLGTVIAAVCTTGDPVRKRFGRTEPPSTDYLILTPASLIAVRDGERPGCVIWSRANAEIQFVSHAVGDQTVSGLTVTAFRPGAAERESTMLLLADDADGLAFAHEALAEG